MASTYSHIDRLAQELAIKIETASSKLETYSGTDALRGSLLALGAEVAKQHWGFMQAVRENNESAINQHTNALFVLEKKLEKLLRPPGMLDLDIRMNFD